MQERRKLPAQLKLSSVGQFDFFSNADFCSKRSISFKFDECLPSAEMNLLKWKLVKIAVKLLRARIKVMSSKYVGIGCPGCDIICWRHFWMPSKCHQNIEDFDPQPPSTYRRPLHLTSHFIKSHSQRTSAKNEGFWASPSHIHASPRSSPLVLYWRHLG